MSKPVTIPNIFAPLTGPLPLANLDADFAAVAAALNDFATYSLYAIDTSLASNQITVTLNPALVFSYVEGIEIKVKLAQVNTSATVNINVNGIGNQLVVNNDGSALVPQQLQAGTVIDLLYDGTNFRVQNRIGRNLVTTNNQTLSVDGTQGAPAYSFASDPDNGMYRSGTNQVSIASGALQTAVFDATFTRLMAGGASILQVEFSGSVGLLRLPSIASATSATAGAASALPATPQGYITVTINGQDRKIPYYLT